VREDLAVARVRRLAAEGDRRAAGAAQDLVHQRELHLAVARAAEIGPEVARPEPALAHALLERRDQLPPHGILQVVGMLDHEIEGLELITYEGRGPVELGLEVGVGLEAPAHRAPPWRRGPVSGSARKRTAERR